MGVQCFSLAYAGVLSSNVKLMKPLFIEVNTIDGVRLVNVDYIISFEPYMDGTVLHFSNDHLYVHNCCEDILKQIVL